MIRPTMRIPTNLRRRGKKGHWYGTWKDVAGRKKEKCLGPRLDVATQLLAELTRNARRAGVGLEDEIGQAQSVPALVAEYLASGQWNPTYHREVRSGLAEILAGVKTVAELTSGRITKARDRLEGSARTRNKKAGWALQFCKWLRRTSRARPSAEEVEPLARHDVVSRRVLSGHEADRLQAAADAPVARVKFETPRPFWAGLGHLVAILLGTGLRLSEALGLTWADLTADGIRVRMPDTRTKRHSRTVPIASELRARLLRAKASRGGGCDRIIVSTTGRPLRVNVGTGGRLMTKLRRAAVAAKVDLAGLDYHALRHTYATWAASGGLTALQLQAVMGWTSVAMADRYVHKEKVDLSGVVAAVRQGGGTGPQNVQKEA